MLTIKSDDLIEEQPPIPISEWIARTVQQQIGNLPFASFFGPDTVLVPVPRSSLMQPDTLRVPHRIATALAKRGLGKEVLACLVRVSPARKAATSKPSERPKPKDHFETISVQGRISQPPPNEILLVDDIITRGATLLGAANRLAQVFPTTRIRAFGAVATISDPSDFGGMYKPMIGTIQYRPQTEDTLRRP